MQCKVSGSWVGVVMLNLQLSPTAVPVSASVVGSNVLIPSDPLNCRAARAVLKLAQAHDLSLGSLPFESNVFPHIQTYIGALELAAQNSGSFGLLASNHWHTGG